MSLQSTDLFAVQRGAITYKTPFSDIQDYVTDQLKATWLPSHLDNPSSIGTSTWNGPADTLAATGSIEVSISGGPFGSGGAVASPTQIQARWKPADVAGAAHDATLTGRIQNTTGSVAVDYTAKVDKLPDPITINGKTGVTPSAAVDSDASSPVNGINAQARLWLNTTDGTSPMVSIAGGAWTAVPTTTAGALPIDAGQTFKLRHTAKAGASVKTTTTVYVGWAAASSAQVAFATTNAATKAPVIGTVTLADSPEADRFTSATFDTTVTMTDEGLPTSTKGLKAWVEGTLKTAAVSDEITAIGGTATNPILTLKTDKDLSLFTAGDVVTQDDSALTSVARQFSPGIQTPPSGFSTSYNGNPFAPGTPAYSTHLKLTAVTGEPFTITFDPPLKDITSLVVRGGCNSPGNPYSLELSDGTQTTHGDYVTSNGYGSPPNLESIIPTSRTVSSITMNSGVEICGFMGITLNGIKLEDGGTFPSIAPAGVVVSTDVTAKTMTLKDSIGTWGPANAGHYVIGPLKTASNVKLYCKLDATLNVQDLQSADPGYTAATGASPYKLTWPAALPSGNPPDTDLPAGTTITTEVQATNTAGTVHKTSNTITPA